MTTYVSLTTTFGIVVSRLELVVSSTFFGTPTSDYDEPWKSSWLCFTLSFGRKFIEAEKKMCEKFHLSLAKNRLYALEKKKSLAVAVSWYDPVTFLQKEMVMRKREGCQMTNFSSTYPHFPFSISIFFLFLIFFISHEWTMYKPLSIRYV